MKEQQNIKLALAVFIVAILVVICINNVNLDNNDNRYPVNDGLTSLIEFDVNASEVGTSAKGTFFVMQSKDSVRIKIVADVEVGETDIGGIGFGIPKGFNIVDIFCSYRSDTSVEYMYVSGTPILGYRVEVAQAHPYYNGTPSGGGKGMVTIELQFNDLFNLNDMNSLEFYVTAGGSKEVTGLEVERISIPVMHDFAT